MMFDLEKQTYNINTVTILNINRNNYLFLIIESISTSNSLSKCIACVVNKSVFVNDAEVTHTNNYSVVYT